MNFTVGSKSIDIAYCVLNSDGCRAASGHLTSSCDSGLATDSSVALGMMVLETLRSVFTCDDLLTRHTERSAATTKSCRRTCDSDKEVLKYMFFGK